MGRAILGLALVGVVACGARREVEGLELALQEASSHLDTAREEARAQAQRAADLSAEVASLKASKITLEDRVVSLERALDDSQEVRARMLADRGALRQEVAAMKGALEAVRARKQQAEERLEVYVALVRRFQSLIDAGTLAVEIVDGRMVVVLRDDVLFSSGSAEISREGKATLQQVAEVLAGMPGRSFQIEGHTDDRPIETARHPSNWFLAADRAIRVVSYLIAEGVQPERLSAASYADTRPTAANDSPDGRARNRRIEIAVVPDLAGLPGYDELSAQ